MARVSNMHRLPPSVRTQVDRWIINRQFTDQKITDWLNEHGFPTSSSAVGRYAKKLRDTTARGAEFLSLPPAPDDAVWGLITIIRQLRESVDDLRQAVGAFSQTQQGGSRG